MAEAKRQVFGLVNIDMIAGPSEVLVIADGKSNPAWVAADLLSQAEHDKMASAVLVTDSWELAQAVSREIEEQLRTLEREEIARASIEANGKIIVARSLKEAAAVANRIAPEHLELSVDDPFDYLGMIENAAPSSWAATTRSPWGTTLPDPTTPCPPWHRPVLQPPVGGRLHQKVPVQLLHQGGPGAGLRKVSRFAREEGLTAHARAVDIRFEGGETMIAIIDYGVGNLFSLKKLSERHRGGGPGDSGSGGAGPGGPHHPPRGGAFGDAAQKLRDTGMFQAVLDQAAKGKPILGICLGMQLLFEKSFEYGEHAGLG